MDFAVFVRHRSAAMLRAMRLSNQWWTSFWQLGGKELRFLGAVEE
jgi:hypothetical protein